MERGLIQVRYGLGSDVEVLPLTMVNMLQALNPKALMPMDLRTNGKADEVMKRPCMNDRVKDQQMDVRMSDLSSDTSEDSKKERQLLEPVCDGSEFEDTELEELVLQEGPQQILQLTLQKQVDHLMREETWEFDDYADWIKWVVDEEKKR